MKRIIPFTFIAVTLLFVFSATGVAKDARSIHHFRMVQKPQNTINLNFEKPVVQVVMFDAQPKLLFVYDSQKSILDLNVGYGFSAAIPPDVMAVEYPFICQL